MEKILKIGDTFLAENILDGELTLVSVFEDANEVRWAVGVDKDGCPFVLEEEYIDDEMVEVFLPPPVKANKKVTKKGKK